MTLERARRGRRSPRCSLVLYFNVNKAAEDPLFFRKTAKSALAASVFVEFFINLFVFGLFAELILQFVLIILILVDAFSSQSHVGEVALGALRAAGALAAPSAGCAAGAPRADTRAVRCAVAGGHSH